MRRVGPPTASPAKPECLRRCSTSGSANWWERRRCNIWRAGACAPPAAHLLREPGRNASGVAYSVGFNSEAAFNRAFKRSEEHTSELQSLMRISYAVFCLKKKNKRHNRHVEK